MCDLATDRRLRHENAVAAPAGQSADELHARPVRALVGQHLGARIATLRLVTAKLPAARKCASTPRRRSSDPVSSKPGTCHGTARRWNTAAPTSTYRVTGHWRAEVFGRSAGRGSRSRVASTVLGLPPDPANLRASTSLKVACAGGGDRSVNEDELSPLDGTSVGPVAERKLTGVVGRGVAPRTVNARACPGAVPGPPAERRPPARPGHEALRQEAPPAPGASGGHREPRAGRSGEVLSSSCSARRGTPTG